MLREYLIGNRVFNIEIMMYTKVRSMLENLLKSRTGNEILLPLPTYYGGICDGENDFLCLEDLRPEGYIMPDKFKGLNLPQVDLALRELAKFHAFSYFLIKHQGEVIFEDESLLQYKKNWFLEPEMQPVVQGMFCGSMNTALNVITKINPELAEKYRALTGDNSNTVSLVSKTSCYTDKKYFPVIIHGDFWSNNILFKYTDSDETKPTAVRFVDFQLTRRGNIFEELQYFMFTSTTPIFRKEHLPSVLNTYYTAFTETLDLINCPRPLNFTKGFFIDSFYDTYLPALGFLSYAIPLQLGQPQEASTEAPASPEDAIRIMQEAMVKQWEQSPRAIQRMENILQEFADLKLI